MKKNLERIIEVPAGVTITVDGKKVNVSGKGKEMKRTFDIGRVKLEMVEGNVKLSAVNATRRESKMIGTIWAHIKNMIKGLDEEFVYELEICNVHFPMNVKSEGNKVVIKSFLGEKVDRFSNVLPETKIEIKGSLITVRSHNIEAAGQTAANLEKATRVRGRDRRVFQDGIFITSKPGRRI